MGLDKISQHRPYRLLAFTSCLLLGTSVAAMAEEVPSVLGISGNGAKPSSTALLISGKKTEKKVVSKDGRFAFTPLAFMPHYPVKFDVEVMGLSVNPATIAAANQMQVSWNPYEGQFRMLGKVPKGSSVVVQVDGVETASSVAGSTGFIDTGDVNITPGFIDGKGKAMISLVTVEETCCPRSYTPLPPINLNVEFMPIPQPAATPSKQPAQKLSYNIIEDTGSYSINGGYATSVTVPPQAISGSWVQGLKDFTAEWVANLGWNTANYGRFADGVDLNEAASRLQELRAISVNRYSPSEAVCRFGSISKSIGATDHIKNSNIAAISTLMMAHESGQPNTSGNKGVDPYAKLGNFKQNYCRDTDENNSLEGFCSTTSTTPTDLTFNRDIDYTRVLDAPLTIDGDFNDTTLTPSEQHIIDLGINIFGDDSVDTKSESADEVPVTPESNSRSTQSQRSVQAIRSLAKNSFSHLVGMKVHGTDKANAYLYAVLKDLGTSQADAEKLLGKNPSYFAQMEVITKKLYQDPAFIARLMDKPENVERQRVAIKAADLMQGQDLLESLHRREMLLSTLLELKLRESEQNKGAENSAN